MLRAILLTLLLSCLVVTLPGQVSKGSNFAAANAAFDDGVKLLLAGKPKRAMLCRRCGCLPTRTEAGALLLPPALLQTG